MNNTHDEENLNTYSLSNCLSDNLDSNQQNITEYFDVTQPITYKTSLFPHQLTAIYMMEKREKEKKIIIYENEQNNTQTFDSMQYLSRDMFFDIGNTLSNNEYSVFQNNFEINTNVGIYSDITGYGKTISIIGMLIRDKMIWNTHEIFIHKSYCTHYGEGRIFATENKKYKKINCNLILMNQSLIKQWENELDKSQLKFYTITNKKHIEACNVEDFDAVIVSPTMYNLFITQINAASEYPVAWKRFIFDEPQNTKISSMKNIIAGFYWFITATPNSLLMKTRNRNHFLTNLFHLYMHKHVFDPLIIKNNDDFVRSSYEMPETIHKYYTTYQPLYKITLGIVNTNITDMLAANNIMGAIKLLGGTTENQCNILDLVRTKKEDKIKEIDSKIALWESRNDSNKVSFWQIKKKELEKQLTNLDQRINETLNTKCTICGDKYNKPIMVSGCCHIFCGCCIMEWIKKKSNCPICRGEIKTNELIYMKNELTTQKDISDAEEILTKEQTIIKLIKSNPNNKFIIFSTFDETFNQIKNILIQENIKYGEIIGTKELRDKIIDDYKNHDTNVLCLNSINNGAGINLQETTDIILYHKMSSQIETQIIGRSNRIGRKTNLSVHHLN